MARTRRFQLSCGHVRRFGDGFAPGLVVRCSTCRDDRAIAVRLSDRVDGLDTLTIVLDESAPADREETT